MIGKKAGSINVCVGKREGGHNGGSGSSSSSTVVAMNVDGVDDDSRFVVGNYRTLYKYTLFVCDCLKKQTEAVVAGR